MSRIAPLATTNRWHIVRRSSQRYSLDDADIDKPWHAFMDDETLAAKIAKDTKLLREYLTENNGSDRWLHFWQTVRDDMVFLDLYYLRDIGRLPAHVDIAALEAELPSKP